MKIELSDDTAVNLVVEDLKASYELCSAYDDKVTMDALSAVLEYYMGASEYKQWKEKDTMSDNLLIEVTELQEHEDGSATVTIDASAEGIRLLVGAGLRALLEKAIAEDKVIDERSES